MGKIVIPCNAYLSPSTRCIQVAGSEDLHNLSSHCLPLWTQSEFRVEATSLLH